MYVRFPGRWTNEGVSSRLPKAFVPLALHGHGGSSRILGLGHQLDGLVHRSNRMQSVCFRRLEQDEGVGGVFLAQRPRLLFVGGPEETGGRGGFETERGGFVGLEEGEELRGQLEELVAGPARGVVKWNADCGELAAGLQHSVCSEVVGLTD